MVYGQYGCISLDILWKSFTFITYDNVRTRVPTRVHPPVFRITRICEMIIFFCVLSDSNGYIT